MLHTTRIEISCFQTLGQRDNIDGDLHINLQLRGLHSGLQQHTFSFYVLLLTRPIRVIWGDFANSVQYRLVCKRHAAVFESFEPYLLPPTSRGLPQSREDPSF